LDDLIR